MGVLQSIDWWILHFIRDNFVCGFLDFVMPKFTLLGDKGIIWIAISLVLIATKKYRKCGLLCLAGMVIGLVVGNVFLKNLAARPRPCWIEDVNMIVSIPGDFSFPSGHTLSSVISTVILMLTNKKFGWFAIPLTVIVAFSRLYLYVHFPTDVVFGAILGVAIGFFTWFLSKKIKPLNRL